MVGSGGRPWASFLSTQCTGVPVLLESPSSLLISRHTVEDGEYPLWAMTETVPKEGFSARLAEIRGQLKLLSDYL
jgi:hypothetical protein